MFKLVPTSLWSFVVMSVWSVAISASQESAAEDSYGDESASDEAGWGAPSSTRKPDEPGEKQTVDSANDEAGWGDGEDDLGFGEREEALDENDATPSEETSEKTPTASPWSVVGFLRSDLGMWVERLETNGFAKARQSLDLSARYKTMHFRFVASLHGEYDFAYLYKRDDYDAATLDTYEWLLDVRDTYLVGTIKDFDITFGKQTMAWGQGDMMSLLDVICPRDLREPGITDMDDMRLPVLSTRLSLFLGNHRLEAIVIHEAFFGYKPPPLGDFSPMGELLSDDIANTLEDVPIWYKDKQARFELKNQQYLARWSYKGPGVDLELYLASVLDNTGTIEFDYVELLSDVAEGNRTEIVLDHSRYTMAGHSGAWPIGAWVLKWELGVDINRAFNVGDAAAIPTQIDTDRASTIGGLVGFTYTGFRDTIIFVEVKKSWILDDIPNPLFSVEEPTIGLRWYRNLIREDLRIGFTLLMCGQAVRCGWLGRVLAEYKIRDGLGVSAGYITYHPGSAFGLLSGMTDNDRFYMQLRWDFTIF